MNRLGFLVLSILFRSEAKDEISSMTVREITETEKDFGLKDNTVFKKISIFEKSGYVARGLKEGRAHTFFITQKGIDFLKQTK